MRHNPTPAVAGGFTLIEILVVVVVIGIALSVVIGSFTSTDREQAFQGYAERLSLKIEMARDKALQRNREWGMYVDEEGVRFSEFDESSGEWVEQSQRPYNAEPFGSTLEFKTKVEAFAGLPTNDDEPDTRREKQRIPDIVIFSSGEVTPFEILLTPKDWETRAWQLASDGFTRVALEREAEF